MAGRESPAETPFPWIRSNDDTRHLAILAGLSTVAGALVLTFFIATTSDGTVSDALGGAFKGG